MMRVAIVGGSGYVGGEMLRLLLDHPRTEVVQVTSERQAGKYVTSAHPNLRGRTRLKFSRLDELRPADLLVICLPHGESMQRLKALAELAPRLIDTSADFRLRDAAAYPVWYGHEHPEPGLLEHFVYGLPELHRKELATARFVSGTGCLATSAILALAPLLRTGVVRLDPIIIECKVGSSAGGNAPSPATHHPERRDSLRSFQPVGHRHTAEIVQELSFNGAVPSVLMSATAVGLVRGILCTAHAFLTDALDEKAVWGIYRDFYGKEPFIRIVKERRGIYRTPEPKILAGSNYCDVGFELDPTSSRIVVLSALDNLMKGAAGNAVQALNVMAGWEETTGLGFAGLHPV